MLAKVPSCLYQTTLKDFIRNNKKALLMKKYGEEIPVSKQVQLSVFTFG